MSKIYLPAKNAEQWREFLAKPAIQWRTGYSAKTIAHCWQDADGFPKCVQQVFDAAKRKPFLRLEVLLALPEHKVKLPGGSTPSQSDIWVLARSADDLVSIAVEGKVAETFGDTLDDWLKDASSGKVTRLAFLQKELELPPVLPGAIKYQLLHRTASALLEAKRFNASHAMMLVHSFSERNDGFADYIEYLKLFGATASPDEVSSVGKRSGIDLHFAWVRGELAYLQK